MGDQSHTAIRQHAPAEALRPHVGIAFHGEIERRLVRVRGCDRARGLFAVMIGPARHQPWRRIERKRIEGREHGFAFARDPAQHGIDEAGITRGMFLGLHQTHREIDGGVIGYIEKQDLRRAEQQSRVRARDFRRQRTFEHAVGYVFQRPEPPQYGRRQHAHQCAVTLFKGLECRGLLLELVVEGAASPQHALKHGSCDLPRGQAGDGRGFGGGFSHAPSLRTKRTAEREVSSAFGT